MKNLLTKLLSLTQFEIIFWPLASNMSLGWLISANQKLLPRISNCLGILCLVMAVFAYGSIEDAPLDALAEGKNADNPLSKGYLSIPDAWKLSILLASIGLLLSIVSSRNAILTYLAILIVGGIYFHHSLRLRQSILLESLGFSILTGLLPFLSAANLSSIHFGNNSLITGSLGFLLAYASYCSRGESHVKGITEENPRTGLSIALLLASILIFLASLFMFTFSGLVPAWVSVLMLALFLIMFYPQFSHHKAIRTETYKHSIFVIYQRALAIALVTFFFATQIFSIIR